MVGDKRDPAGRFGLPALLLQMQQLRKTQEPKERTGVVIPFPGRRTEKGKEFKPEFGKRKGMVDNKAEDEKSLFPAVRTEEGEGWAAVMFLEDDLSKPVSKSDKAGLMEAKKRVIATDLPEKGDLLDYLKLAETGDRFAVTQAERIMSGYLGGKVPKERFAFEVRLMDAWCNGGINGFIESELGSLAKKKIPDKERKKLNDMLDLALSRSEVMKAVTAGVLHVYYPLHKPEERLDQLDKMTYVLTSAKPAREQQL